MTSACSKQQTRDCVLVSRSSHRLFLGHCSSEPLPVLAKAKEGREIRIGRMGRTGTLANSSDCLYCPPGKLFSFEVAGPLRGNGRHLACSWFMTIRASCSVSGAAL